MKTPKSPPARADAAPADSKTTTRFNADDLYLLKELSRATGITNRSDVLRNCIRTTAKEHGIALPPRAGKRP